MEMKRSRYDLPVLNKYLHNVFFLSFIWYCYYSCMLSAFAFGKNGNEKMHQKHNFLHTTSRKYGIFGEHRLRLRLRQNLFNKNIQVPYQVHTSFLKIQITL